MAVHNDIGTLGENLAVVWLKERGYEVLYRNWRYGRHEIDIVATKKNKLHFIEVKTRKGNSFGRPEESVTRSKFRNLKRAAHEFLYQYPGYEWIQYDIMAIVIKKERVEYFLLEDVFL